MEKFIMKKQLIAAAVAASMSAFAMADLSITGDAKYEYDHTDTNGTKTNDANTEMHINFKGKTGDTTVVANFELDTHGTDGGGIDLEDNYLQTKVGDLTVKAGNYASSTSGLLGELEEGGRASNKVTVSGSIGGVNLYAGNSGGSTAAAGDSNSATVDGNTSYDNNMFVGASMNIAGNTVQVKKNNNYRDSWGIKGSLSGVNYRVEGLSDNGEKSGITKGDATYYEVDTTINGIKVQYATIDADNATLIDETDSAVFAIEPGAKSNSTGGKQVAISTAVDGTTIKLISGSVEKGLSTSLDLDYVQVSASRPLASGATAVITYTDEDYLASGASSATSKENLEVELNVKF